MNCSISIIADTEAELLDAAVQHAVAVHDHQDTPETEFTPGSILLSRTMIGGSVSTSDGFIAPVIGMMNAPCAVGSAWRMTTEDRARATSATTMKAIQS